MWNGLSLQIKQVKSGIYLRKLNLKRGTKVCSPSSDLRDNLYMQLNYICLNLSFLEMSMRPQVGSHMSIAYRKMLFVKLLSDESVLDN